MWTVAAEGSGRPRGLAAGPSPAPGPPGPRPGPLDGRLYAAGGLTGGEATADVEAFDPRSERWAPVASSRSLALTCPGGPRRAPLRRGRFWPRPPALAGRLRLRSRPGPLGARAGAAGAPLQLRRAVLDERRIHALHHRRHFVLDPRRQAWARARPMPTSRHGLGLGALGGRLFAGAAARTRSATCRRSRSSTRSFDAPFRSWYSLVARSCPPARRGAAFFGETRTCTPSSPPVASSTGWNAASDWKERLGVEPGSRLDLPEVLLIADGEQVTVGQPTVPGARVVVEVLGEIKAKKIIVFKYKAKCATGARTGTGSASAASWCGTSSPPDRSGGAI